MGWAGWLRWIGIGVLAALAVAALYVGGVYLGLYGRHLGPGEPTADPMPREVLAERLRIQERDAAALTPAPVKQILFGDLHVHTTFSTDAFLASLPMMGGQGAHPVGDACDFARHCSALDFWSINDHAEASTPRRWRETVEAMRTCNALAGDPAHPDVAAFLGWEWSQVGATPEEHYGHKNVVLKGLADDEIPVRPIGAGGLATDALRGPGANVPRLLPLADWANRQRYYDFIEFLQEIRRVPACPEGVDTRELPPDCYESADTPAGLFEKLAQWDHESLVIPHGNSWGFYSPPGTTWDKQLRPAHRGEDRQILIEVMSGHGNSEEYRDWRAVRFDAEGEPFCPEPTPDYLPSCWRAGEIVAERCRAEGGGEAECAERAAQARQSYAEAGAAGHLTVKGESVADWLDAGQCRDCFLPSFNHRPGGSTQYALALSDLSEEGEGETSGGDDGGEPGRFRFGFITSSDNHRARPGTGYKELGRRAGHTDAAGPTSETWRRRILGPREEPLARSVPVEQEEVAGRGLRALEVERQASFFMTGGLAAVHAEGRSREAVWDAFQRREVYGTSGDRILLWFHALGAPRPDGSFGSVPMGGEVRMDRAPRFEVRAVGAFEQAPGCPDHAVRAAGPERLDALCAGECYHPTDRRKRISRIEVVRIRPRVRPDEPVAELVEDPWRVLPCEPLRESGCVVQFEDPEFVDAARDAVYYVRAIQEPSLAVNADPLRCERDAQGRCVEARPCYGDYRTPRDEDCLAPAEERAWSSPIFVGFGEPS